HDRAWNHRGGLRVAAGVVGGLSSQHSPPVALAVAHGRQHALGAATAKRPTGGLRCLGDGGRGGAGRRAVFDEVTGAASKRAKVKLEKKRWPGMQRVRPRRSTSNKKERMG